MKFSTLCSAAFVCLSVAILSANLSYAHGNMGEAPGTKANAAISATWRDDGMLQPAGYWQIPGVLMGGEAFPVEQGFTVDEARISVYHRTTHDVFGLLQVSSHDGSSSAEIHHAFVGVDLRPQSLDDIRFTVVAGRMAADMTPANGEHASDRLFSEAPLALDAFLGRQLNDDGARLAVSYGGLQLGVESWHGNAFPATSGADGGSYDVYLHYRNRSQHWNWFAALWWLQADALARTDTRYSADGHQHGTAVVEVPQIWFDGRSDLGGAFLRVGYEWSELTQMNFEIQYLQADVEGDLRDETRTTEWIAEDNGGWIQASVEHGNHTVGLRWEKLVLENQLIGAAADALATLSGLSNQDHDPERSTLTYQWQVKPSLALRLEAIQDDIQVESVQRLAVGVVWQADLLD